MSGKNPTPGMAAAPWLLLAMALIGLFGLSGCGGASGSDSSYIVGGTVTGLNGNLLIKNLGVDDLSLTADGRFAFSIPVPAGGAFNVTVATQPAGQTCTVTKGRGTVSVSDITTVAIACVTTPTAPTYTIGGTILGLTGTVVLVNNGANGLSRTANGDFVFTIALINNSPYNVTVLSQPAGQRCTVANGSGAVNGDNVMNVRVSCATLYTIGGEVTGLTDTVVLQNNGANDLSITANGDFSFTTRIDDGGNYDVTVLTHPDGQTCAITDGSGTVAGANVTTANVFCITTLALEANPQSGNVRLSWNDTGATSHDLYLSTASDCDIASYASCADGALVTAVTSPHMVTALTDGQVYYFWLVAHYTGGNITIVNQTSARPDALTTNGTVLALATHAGTGFKYLGGQFTDIGARSGGGIPLSPAYAGPAINFPLVTGQVLACASDGNGGYFIGGSFTHVGGSARNNLAHMLADGTVDPAWNPDANGQVNALVVSGTTVFMGGDFTSIGGQARNRLAAVETDGTLASWNPGANGGVNAIAIDGATVYAGGNFTSISGQTRNHLAAIGTDGTLAAWNPNASSAVNALAISGNTVYAGGTFTTLGGQPRNRIAAIGTDGTLAAWNPNATSWVNALVVSGTTIYAGGAFTGIGGQTRNHLAAIGTDGTLAAWNPDADDWVNTIAINGSTVYAGGLFTSVGGQTRKRLAAIGTNGTLATWNPSVSAAVSTLATDGNTVYAGGAFTSLGGQTRNRLAALEADGTLADWDPNANDAITALAIMGNTVYVGGAFTSIGTLTRNRLAAIDTDGTVSISWNPNASATVNALAVNSDTFSDTVYAGGAFTSIGGQTRNRIAAIGTDGSISATWNPNANNYVYTLAVSGTTIYAGGAFSSIGGQARNCLAALNNTTGAATAWDPGANSPVYAMMVSGSVIYAGGTFSNIGGQTRNRLAALDATTAAATAWDADANDTVYALAVSGSTVYAGGAFTSIGGQARNRLAALDDGTAAATVWDPDANDSIYALMATGTEVYAGGLFDSMGTAPAVGFAILAP